MSWTSERGESFEAMLDPAMYGISFLFQGKPFDCIAPPAEQINQMMQTGYEMNVPLSFSMRQSDFNSSGIGLRSFIQYSLLTFEVYALDIDPVDPIVDLKVFYKQ